jgi:ferredoxin
MSFKVVVDMDLCQNHGQCAFAAPEVFQINYEGVLVVLNDEPDESQRAACEDAADVCPVQAITIVG